MSRSLKSELPATRTSAPASTHCFPVVLLMPPSTSIRQRSPRSLRIASTASTFGTHSGWKLWPPNPAFTVMMSTRSTSSRYGSRTSTGVAGSMAIPALIPRSLIFLIAAAVSPSASWCTVSTSAPAFAKSST